MPRTAAANQDLRDASRRRILDAALREFAARGYASTPVDAIVRAAGISPGLLYHYFPSKLDVLRAVFEESMADVQASFAAADDTANPRDRLAALLRAASAIVKERRDFWALSYGVRMQREVLDALGPNVHAWTSQILGVLEGYLRDAGWPQPALEARLLFAEIDGMHQHYVLVPLAYPLDELTERLVDRYRASHDAPAKRSPRRRRSR
jgi:AcrR family transcriptional regulator